MGGADDRWHPLIRGQRRQIAPTFVWDLWEDQLEGARVNSSGFLVGNVTEQEIDLVGQGIACCFDFNTLGNLCFDVG